MREIENSKMRERIQTIDRIILALKGYWKANPELEYKDILAAILAEFDLEDANCLTDTQVEKFLTDSLENDT